MVYIVIEHNTDLGIYCDRSVGTFNNSRALFYSSSMSECIAVAMLLSIEKSKPIYNLENWKEEG